MLNQKKETSEISDIKGLLEKYESFNENFEIIRQIGSGCESKVYNILHKKNKREFAIKHILKKRSKHFLNELKIASKLKHRNIINFLGNLPAKEDNSEFIVMENGKYGNLNNFQRQILKRRCLSESMANYLTHQILAGLLHCHRCKIAHMDIKPQNIVIDEYLNAKIIDFSVSINYENKKPNDKIKLPFCGTHFYMCSQVINSSEIKVKDLNKVDIYSFGVLLYKLVFGYYPFNLKSEDDENYKVINQKINSEYEIKNDINFSSYFIDFISKILQRDINKRMNIYEAMEHPWMKGAQLLIDEKENIYNSNLFVLKLITDNIKNFNDYLSKKI